MSKIKAVVLVLASHDKVIYQEFREVYKKYLNVNPNIKVFLLYGSSANFEQQPYDLVWPNIVENYWPGMMLKNIEGFKFIDTRFNYDFLIRTNLSTFWIWDRLLKRLDSLPSEKMYTGCFRRCYINHKKTNHYISGTSLILSRDLVKVLINHSDSLLKDEHPEDYVISNFLLNQGIDPFKPSLLTMQLLEHLKEFKEEKINNEILEADRMNKDHFRIKSMVNREEIDIAVAKTLLSRYYGGYYENSSD